MIDRDHLDHVDHYEEARRELLGAEIARRQWFEAWAGFQENAEALAQTVQHCLATAHVHALLAQVQRQDGTTPIPAADPRDIRPRNGARL